MEKWKILYENFHEELMVMLWVFLCWDLKSSLLSDGNNWSHVHKLDVLKLKYVEEEKDHGLVCDGGVS